MPHAITNATCSLPAVKPLGFKLNWAGRAAVLYLGRPRGRIAAARLFYRGGWKRSRVRQ